MTLDDQFTFHCGPDLDCFTECCRDVSIVLTPYDVLRLKKALRMDSTEFLEKHTLPLFSPQQKFPLVILRMDPETKKCPFVTEQGCEVYADRPWACRMYPLGVAKPKNPRPPTSPFISCCTRNSATGTAKERHARCANGSRSRESKSTK